MEAARDPHTSLTKLHSESFREKALRAIRAGIITGEIAGGEIHSARTLAEQLGVSATPVREALLELANEGLVVPVRNRGFRVIGLTEHDLDEIFELRMMLEIPATVAAADLLNPQDHDGLRALATQMEDDAAIGDVEAWLNDDLQFHLKMIGAGGNGRLVDLVRRLRDQTRLTALRELAASGELGRFAAEHHALVDALVARDGRKVQALLAEHLRHTRGAWAGRDEASISV